MTREELIRMARDAGWNWPEVHTTSIEDRLERFAALVAAVEREECAKRVEVFDRTFNTGGVMAGAIRARK